MDAPVISGMQRLELDVDLRLTQIWEQAAKVDEWTLERVAVFMRACYGRGYGDAHTEEIAAQLYRDNEMPVPGRDS
jgi:hypothetical protein